MVHRRMLNEDQISQLFDPPIDRRAIIRHYTLSPADLALIRRGRGDHHRLGYALMLCYLRHPGRPLRAGETPPTELVSFVADQINVFPSEFEAPRLPLWNGYAARCAIRAAAKSSAG